MLRALQDLLAALAPSPNSSPADQQHALHLATAVLLVEVMRADPEVKDTERTAVMAALRRKFPLADDEIARLLELAEANARNANDLFAFTSTINDRFPHPDKVRMVEHMWEVAYSDGQLEENEHHLISKVAGLLHVTHGEYIAAKLHAKQSAGLPRA